MAFPNDGKKFPKGKSGNPEGRPKTLPILKERLTEHLAEEGVDEMISTLQELGRSGNVKAIELLLAYCYGKAKETVDMNHNFENRPPWLDAAK